MNSSALAEMLRHEWGIESFASVNIRSLVYNNIRNLTVLWFPMKDNISGCCSKTKDDKVIFINTNHTIGRQNFTLAHELYHLLYEDIDDFIVCGVNNNSQSERNADNFASTLFFIVGSIALNPFNSYVSTLALIASASLSLKS